MIQIKTLRTFWEKHADGEQQIKARYQEAEKASWNNTNELKADYPSASILEDNRICFNIKGNHYHSCKNKFYASNAMDSFYRDPCSV